LGMCWCNGERTPATWLGLNESFLKNVDQVLSRQILTKCPSRPSLTDDVNTFMSRYANSGSDSDIAECTKREKVYRDDGTGRLTATLMRITAPRYKLAWREFAKSTLKKQERTKETGGYFGELADYKDPTDDALLFNILRQFHRNTETAKDVATGLVNDYVAHKILMRFKALRIPVLSELEFDHLVEMTRRHIANVDTPDFQKAIAECKRVLYAPMQTQKSSYDTVFINDPLAKCGTSCTFEQRLKWCVSQLDAWSGIDPMDPVLFCKDPMDTKPPRR